MSYIEIITIIFFLFSVIISGFQALKKNNVDICENSESIITFIISGTKLILKHFYYYLFLLAICFCSFSLVIKLYYSESIFQSLLILPALFTSCLSGWFGLSFSVKSTKYILSLKHHSTIDIINFTNKRSTIILALLMSIVLIDVSIWIIGLNTILSINLFNSNVLFANLIGFTWPIDIENSLHFNNLQYAFITISLAGYSAGSILHAILARFNFSIFATAFDTSSDLIGYSKYDFPEDDVRNPGSIPDFIGDQLKHNYLIFTNLHSTAIITIIAISISGSFLGLLNQSTYTFSWIFFPIFLTSISLFVNVTFTPLFNTFLYLKEHIFLNKFFQLIFINLIILVGVYLVLPLDYISNQIFFAIVIGFASVLFFYPIIYAFLSNNFKIIQYVARHSHNSILNTITTGLFLGFLGTFIIALGLSILIASTHIISISSESIFNHLYLLGCISLGLFLGSLPIISDGLSKPIIDNAVAVSNILDYSTDKKSILQDLHHFHATSITYFKIINTVIIALIINLYLMFYFVKSLKIYLLQESLFNLSTTALINTIIKMSEINNFIIYSKAHFLNLQFMIGAILGICFLFGFIAVIMLGISISYNKINLITQDELIKKPEIFNGFTTPNYYRLILNISHFTNKFMIINFFVLIFVLIFTWSFLGTSGTIGFLIGQFLVGILLSIFFNFSGTIWSNTKQFIEKKPTYLGTPVHVAVIFSDKLGDIFKDAIGPIIVDNIKFIILLAILFIVMIVKLDTFIY